MQRPAARFRGLPLLLAVLALTALAVVLTPGGSATARATPAVNPQQPNIILILTDDQDLLLGSLDVMPNVRALLTRQGTSFSHFLVPLSLCCPSRASILTGRYAHTTQIYTNDLPDGGFPRFHELGYEEETIAVALQAAGYRTAMMGKYLNDYPLGVADSYVPPGWDEWDVPSGGAPYTEFNYVMNTNGALVSRGAAATDYMTDVLSKRARTFVSQAAADKAPFFLFLAPYAPHKPCTPAPRHAKLFPKARVPRTPSFNEADVSDKPAAIRNLPPLNAGDIANLDALYRLRLQTLQAVDEMVASLVNTLTRSGQLANTYILFASDNGFHMGQHRMGATKYTPYEEDIRVPLIVRGPGVPARRVVNALAENVDLAPTLAELAGATLRVPPDGRSLVPLFGGTTPPDWRRLALLEQFHFRDVPNPDDNVREPSDDDRQVDKEYTTHLGLRADSWKYVEYPTGEREVYDLAHDPYELQNLASRADPNLLNRLSYRVHSLEACAGETCRQLERMPIPSPVPP